MDRRYYELRELPEGARFHFLAFPEQTATLIEKTVGRALIRYDVPRYAETKTFRARDRKTGAPVVTTISVPRSAIEPCALGAQVIPITNEGSTV